MKNNSTNKLWFALYTKPRNEFKAEQQLTAAGINNYLPTVTLLKQWSDRKKKVTEPLLRGYIFIYANEEERLVSVEQLSIVRCVFDVGRPARIPDWQINNLRTMLYTKADVIVHKGIVPGAKVKARGPDLCLRLVEGPAELGRVPLWSNQRSRLIHVLVGISTSLEASGFFADGNR